jgi:nucleoside-diphosphate-sugar epimerase
MHDFLAIDFARLESDAIERCAALDGKRLYLTGASGFFGKNFLALLDFLQRRGVSFEATALSRSPHRILGEQGWLRLPWLKWVEGDVRSPWPTGTLNGYDLVLHAATDTAASAHTDKLAVFDGILAGTRQALSFAAAHGVQRLLLCGSGAQYGAIPQSFPAGVPESSLIACDPSRPASAYGEAKRAAEMLAALHSESQGIEVVNARCFAFVGPGLALDGHFAIGNFLRAALAGESIVLSSRGHAVRSYLYGADLAVWLLILLLHAPPGAAVNVGSDVPISVLDLASRVRNLVSPASRVEAGSGSDDGERSFYLPSIRRARELGLDVWTDLDRAIARTAAWHRQQLRRDKP